MSSVLIVDDSPTMRRMVRASLQGLPNVGFQEAGSGLEALEKLALGPVDLLILDLNMPDMHGLDLLRFLRGHKYYSGVPVIVLTTRGDDGSRLSALENGASMYVTKPFAPASLAQQAKQLLNSNSENS
jgi:two-component system, chemotaxis family, chemotaxis protein CheY